MGGVDGPGGRLVLADRGYDSRAVREGIRARGFEPRIPVRNKHHAGRRRDSLARERTAVERTFAWLSYMRRLGYPLGAPGRPLPRLPDPRLRLVCWRRLAKTL